MEENTNAQVPTPPQPVTPEPVPAPVEPQPPIVEEKPKHAGGRPKLWTDPEVVKKLIDNYFKEATKPTLAGLAYSLGISRNTLNEYGEDDEFSDIINEARSHMHAIYEEKLIHSTTQVTGVIFAMKNLGRKGSWKDRSDVTTNDKAMPTPIYGSKSADTE